MYIYIDKMYISEYVWWQNKYFLQKNIYRDSVENNMIVSGGIIVM